MYLTKDDFGKALHALCPEYGNEHKNVIIQYVYDLQCTIECMKGNQKWILWHDNGWRYVIDGNVVANVRAKRCISVIEKEPIYEWEINYYTGRTEWFNGTQNAAKLYAEKPL